MERLTLAAEKLPGGGTRIPVVDANAVRDHAMEIYWQLKAYEDTGLTPEEVAFLVSPEMQEVAEIMKECLEDIQNGKEHQAWGVPAERLYEMAEAEKEGRLVILPCAIGTTVYEIRCKFESGASWRRKKYDYSTSCCPWRINEEPHNCYVAEKKCVKTDFNHMGRTVFLTQEEAEAKLREVQG